MERTNVKNALRGVVIALAAAYFFAVLLIAVTDGPGGLKYAFGPLALFALVYTSWVVVPLGAALGMLIPRIAAGKNRWAAALHGAGYGAAGGLAAMMCFSSVFFNTLRPDMLWVGLVAYCAVWVGAYGYIRAKAPALPE